MPGKDARTLFSWFVFLVRYFLVAVVGALAAFFVIAILFINNKPDLSVWHKAHLDAEFSANSDISTLREYLAIEDRVFSQLQTEVYEKIADTERTAFNRYNSGSRSDPGIWPRNWNRTFELESPNASYGVLLLHGYSDSPYSLRAIGQMLRDDGADVLGLRIPGHGTAPSALKYTVYEDMAAAVRIGMGYLAGKLKNRPVFIVGYSNGGALAVEYATAAVADQNLRKPAGIVIISPEIGVTPVARLARWQAWVGNSLGLEKLAWSEVLPEYDPYKYNSFAINAGEQAYRLTKIIQERIARLEEQGLTRAIPPIIAFQSAVDATVSARALIEHLFARLTSGDHQLVAFDVNRMYVAQNLLKKPVDLEFLTSGPPRPYGVAVVTNRSEYTPDVIVRSRREGQTIPTDTELGASWPDDVYSLSHIALPFPWDDALYGNNAASSSPGVQLGHIALRGENGVLAISPSAMTRIHANPFFPYMAQRIRQFVADNVQQ